MERLVQERRARETGTLVQIVDRGVDDFERAEAREQGIAWNRWETICVEHGAVCSHESLALARRHAPVPTEWCEDCMASVGFRDGFDDEYVPPEER